MWQRNEGSSYVTKIQVLQIISILGIALKSQKKNYFRKCRHTKIIKFLSIIILIIYLTNDKIKLCGEKRVRIIH
jgi:hypothetical protein